MVKRPLVTRPGSYYIAYHIGKLRTHRLLSFLPSSLNHEDFADLLPLDPETPEIPNSSLFIDGPFGGIATESYESIFITARGRGILGALSAAFHIGSRKYHDDQNRAKLQNLIQRLNTLGAESISQGAQIRAEKRKLEQSPLFRDLTRRVSIFWAPEDNSEAFLMGKYVEMLKKLDPQNVS